MSYSDIKQKSPIPAENELGAGFPIQTVHWADREPDIREHGDPVDIFITRLMEANATHFRGELDALGRKMIAQERRAEFWRAVAVWLGVAVGMFAWFTFSALI